MPESQYLCAPINFFIPQFTPIVMEQRNYETVFIVTPVLNESQVQETVEKFTQVLKENSAALLSTEAWGLRKLAYPIQKKSTGYYFCLSFTGSGNVVDVLELAFRRDERIIAGNERFGECQIDPALQVGVDVAQPRVEDPDLRGRLPETSRRPRGRRFDRPEVPLPPEEEGVLFCWNSLSIMSKPSSRCILMYLARLPSVLAIR